MFPTERIVSGARPSHLLVQVASRLCDLGKYCAGRSRGASCALRLPPFSRRRTMQSRTSHSHVTFRRPFRLAGMDTWPPAGRSKVDLEEQRLDFLPAEAWRQTPLTPQGTPARPTDHLSVA